MRAYNFSAGPAALPQPVLEQARDELLDWRGQRASVMELSHRGKAFVQCAEEAEADLRELLAVPDSHRVLFLQGGATQQFALIPMNLAGPHASADYVLSGHWSEKAVAEARRVCDVRIAASSAGGGYTDVPDAAGWQRSEDAAYLHYTSNETIHGVQFHDVPDSGHVPLVADMSSDILSRPLDVSRFGLVYAGAQKNIGPSGLCVLVVHEELLARSPETLPSILRYAAHAASDSMLNTPPTFAWYLAGLVFRWLKGQGGLAAMERHNRDKAALLYAAIDGSGGFYRNPVAPRARSWMNVPFTLQDPALDGDFLAGADRAGLLALKGHRAVGGMRASLYNAMPVEGVRALVDYMGEFARVRG